MDIEIAGSTIATNKEELENGSSLVQPICSLGGTGDNGKDDMDLERGRRWRYFTKCVPLCRAALKGDWPAAKTLINGDKSLAIEPITETKETLLHVAAGAARTEFVRRLLELPVLDNAALEMEDGHGNTAFCYAVAAGAKEIAVMLLRKNPNLLNLRSSAHGVTPLYYAALFGRFEMANFLYGITKHQLTSKDEVDIFFAWIDTGFYDLALKLLAQNAKLAVARRQSETALHVLARRRGAFDSANDSLAENFKLSGLGSLSFGKKFENSKAFELCHLLWEIMKLREDVKAVIREPTHVLFDAARNGNFQIVELLIRSYPDLAWETNKDNHSIFHAHFLQRDEITFRLIHEIGLIKDVITSYEDEKGNNMLHLVAQLQDQNELNLTLCGALEVQRELLWFKEVKEVMHPSSWDKPNKDGQTPRQLFMAEHKSLIEKGRKWIIMLILMAMLIFVGAFSLIGELHNKNAHRPIWLHQNANAFRISATACVVAFTSSSIALWIFLSKLVHPYQQRGLEIFKTYKVIIGLSVLLISTISLLVAFFTTFALGSGNMVDGLASIPLLFLILVQCDLLKKCVTF